MNFVVCKDYDEMSKKAADVVAECIARNPHALISFPGGDTPLGMFQEFVRRVNEGEIDISNVSYVSLDEWVGLSDQDEGSCGHFNQINLIQVLDKPFKQVHIINGQAADLQEEANRLDAFIQENGPLTVSVLGIGLNGHLGFNEEGADIQSNAHIIPLSETTQRVMSKYFGDKFSPTEGITQGLGQIMKANTVVLIANGEKKADIIARAAKGEVTPLVPASILQQHENCFVILDKAAAERL